MCEGEGNGGGGGGRCRGRGRRARGGGNRQPSTMSRLVLECLRLTKRELLQCF